MSDTRLPTHIWVDGWLRRCTAEGIPYVVIQKGERMGGTVMIKLYCPPGECRLLSQIRNLEGGLEWYQPHKEETLDEIEASARIKRATENDPDLWVIEVETRDGQLPFDPTLE